MSKGTHQIGALGPYARGLVRDRHGIVFKRWGVRGVYVGVLKLLNFNLALSSIGPVHVASDHLSWFSGGFVHDVAGDHLHDGSRDRDRFLIDCYIIALPDFQCLHQHVWVSLRLAI